jgi:hypothetical protein
MYLKFSCNLCKSSNITRGRVIEHLPCGYISFDNKFLLSTGILVCPKCNKRLNAIGIDYSKPGLYYQCLDCKAILPEVERTYHCMDCGNNSSYEELSILQIPHYAVNQDKLPKEFGRREYLNLISSRLVLDGIRNSIPGFAFGASNIQHSFSLVVFFDDKNNDDSDNGGDSSKPLIAADTIVEGQSAETQVLSLFAKCMDTGINHRFIFSERSVDEKTRSLAEAYSIKIIEDISKPQSLENALKMIKEITTTTTSTNGSSSRRN